jgi:hypothetical protein
MYRVLWREVVEKVSKGRYDLPPDLLYEKVGSQECFPSSLQIKLVCVNPKRVLVQLGLLHRIFILHAKLHPWATIG